MQLILSTPTERDLIRMRQDAQNGCNTGYKHEIWPLQGKQKLGSVIFWWAEGPGGVYRFDLYKAILNRCSYHISQFKIKLDNSTPKLLCVKG